MKTRNSSLIVKAIVAVRAEIAVRVIVSEKWLLTRGTACFFIMRTFVSFYVVDFLEEGRVRLLTIAF